jgi:hypothetical protein
MGVKRNMGQIWAENARRTRDLLHPVRFGRRENHPGAWRFRRHWFVGTGGQMARAMRGMAPIAQPRWSFHGCRLALGREG